MPERVTYPDKNPGDVFEAAEATTLKQALNALGTAADYFVGTLAGQIPMLNTAGKLDISVIPDGLVGGGGTGDVNGPASSVDGLPVLFDGVSGKQIKAGTAAQILPTGGTDLDFVQQVDGAATWVGAEAIQTALDVLNEGVNDVAQYTTRGRITSGVGPLESLNPGQQLDVLAQASAEDKAVFALDILAGVTETPATVTYALHLDGTAFAAYYSPYTHTILNAEQEIAYAATVTLDYSAAGNITSRISHTNCTGNCALVFDNMEAAWVGQEIQHTFYNTSGGSITVGPTIGTTNGIEVKETNASVLNPGIGTAAGDGLTVFYWIKSTTEIVVRAYLQYTA